MVEESQDEDDGERLGDGRWNKEGRRGRAARCFLYIGPTRRAPGKSTTLGRMPSRCTLGNRAKELHGCGDPKTSRCGIVHTVKSVGGME